VLPLSVEINGKLVTGLVCSSTLSNVAKVVLPGGNALSEYNLSFQEQFVPSIDGDNPISGKFTLNRDNIIYKSSTGLKIISGCNKQNDTSSIVTCTISNVGSAINPKGYIAIDYDGNKIDDLLYQNDDNTVYASTNTASSSVSFNPSTSITLPQIWNNNFAKIQKANFTYTKESDLYLQVNNVQHVLISKEGKYISTSTDSSGMLDLKHQGNQWQESDCWKVTIGDFDGNGISDFIAAAYGEVTIMFGDSFKFGDSPLQAHYKVNTYPYSMKLPCITDKGDENTSITTLDANLDGRTDIICHEKIKIIHYLFLT